MKGLCYTSSLSQLWYLLNNMKLKYFFGLVTPLIMLVLGLLVYDQVTSANSVYRGFLDSIGYYTYIYNPQCVRKCLFNWPHDLISIFLVVVPGFLGYWFAYRHWTQAGQDVFMRGLRMGFFTFIGLLIVVPTIGLISLLF